MGYVLGFLARECGWSKDFIADNFTLQQIELYHKVICQEKNNELGNYAMATLLAVGRAQGSIKERAWNDFMNLLRDKKNIDVNQTIKKLKMANIPIEEK